MKAFSANALPGIAESCFYNEDFMNRT